MAKTPDSVQFTVGVRGPSGKWEEIGTVDVPVSVVTRREGAFIDLARSRRIDNTPCPICGGDRLRTDFTGSGRCHAGPFAPGGITINNDPPERGLPPMTDRKRSAISGEFVTAEYADTHPDTTVSERRPARAAASESDALRAELDHMTEARDNARDEAERLAARIEAAKQIGLGTHLGRPWANVVNDMLRALDGKVLP